MSENNSCFVVVDGDDGYVDGTIRIFSTRQKAEEFIKKYKETMKKGKNLVINSLIIMIIKR